MSLPACRRHVACLAVLALVACSDRGADGTAPATAATAASVPVVAEGPCRLLTVAEVRAVLPKAGPGTHDSSRKEYGIDACLWEDAGGRFAVQTWKAKPGTIGNEIRGLSSGFLDPRNPAAKHNVRFEEIPAIGDQAIAVIEIRDEQRGILTDVATLAIQRGDQVIVLIADSAFARRDRAQALDVLKRLGQAVTARY